MSGNGRSGTRARRKLILIRHSAVTMDPNVPSHQWRLSADGRERCRRLAGYVASHAPDIFVTSIEQKAMETGQILAQRLGVPWRTAANLHEHDRRSASHFESEEEFRAAVVQLLGRPDEHVFGLETGNEALARFDAAVQRVLDEERAGHVAIVAHGTVITLYVCKHMPDLDPIPFWSNMTLPCAFTIEMPLMRLMDEWKVR